MPVVQVSETILLFTTVALVVCGSGLVSFVGIGTDSTAESLSSDTNLALSSAGNVE